MFGQYIKNIGTLMTITKFLDPKNDFTFKKVFGTEKNKDILIHFLNDILEYRNEKMIEEVEFLQTIQDPDIIIYKQSIIDVLCKDKLGRQFIVEMQLSRHPGFEKRAQLYAAKAYCQQQIGSGKDSYTKLMEIIFIAVANFVMFPEKKSYKSYHKILDSATFENNLKDFHFMFLELPKFKKSINELETIVDKWLYFFKHAQEASFKDIEHLIKQENIMKRAFEAIDQASWNEAELRTYEQFIKHQLDNVVVEGYKLEEAEKKGRQKGRTEGEYNKAIEIAKNLLKSGLAPDIISSNTGLSIEEVEGLKN